MTKRARFPQTFPEAERTLWHALDHLREQEDFEASEIIREAICEVQGEQDER